VPPGPATREINVHDLVRVWRSTRLIVLTAVSAALYAAVLIPFKAIPIIPGATEIRPANALPIVFSFLFGPAGAWGSAFGNLIGDTFGTLGPGTVFGFLGNLVYGYLPYRIWGAWSAAPLPSGAAGWTGYVAITTAASTACALVIGWGLHALGFVPFPILSGVILVNNIAMSAFLSPLLLRAIHPRVRRWGLVYRPPAEPGGARVARRIAGVGAALAAASGVVAGHLVAGRTVAGIEDPVTILLLPIVLVLFALVWKA
jgi:energy-coupling factor transport system substrate-specific component